MTEEEFRAELLAAASSRAQVNGCGLREAFVVEVLDRLAEAGEVPDAELCAEVHTGARQRKLEMDAWAADDADGSFHLFVAILDGGTDEPAVLTLTEARDHGFGRLVGIFEQAREGWLTANIEESRPLWALASKISKDRLPPALRVHVLSDRPISERLREIPSEATRENVPITFQIWDVTRLKRIHDAGSARDDLVVDFSDIAGGGLPVLPASVGAGDYDGYLAVMPAEVLADIYVRHGSRLLEGNVRTFLGRKGRVNKGIAQTLADAPAKFFAYNNGIAATASAVTKKVAKDGSTRIISATDLQIVNGAQTTASIASERQRLAPGSVFVPMKLSVVTPEAGEKLIPLISRYANSQNKVRESDFFANHPFHQRIEEISRRLLAPAVGGSQSQTHWYYERARGQYLNDQAGMNASKRKQFQFLNPRSQLMTKTDLAKVECCFELLPDITCKGAEKAFVAFAERIANEWENEAARAAYGDDWFRAAAARVILFRAAEAAVSKADWYDGGYRAQIVAYTCARLVKLAKDQPESGGLGYLKIWTQQGPGATLDEQILRIAKLMADVLRKPPLAGQNISEWAKQPACRTRAFETPVTPVKQFDRWIIGIDEGRALKRQQKVTGRIDSAIDASKFILEQGADYWRKLRDFGKSKRMLSPEDERALVPACQIPRMLPTDRQATRLMELVERAQEQGWKSRDASH